MQIQVIFLLVSKKDRQGYLSDNEIYNAFKPAIHFTPSHQISDQIRAQYL